MFDWLIGHVASFFARATSGEQEKPSLQSVAPPDLQRFEEGVRVDRERNSGTGQACHSDVPIINQDANKTFLRGFRRGDWLADGSVKPDAFLPDPKTAARRRSEGLIPLGEETSINWEDTGDVVGKTLGDVNGQFGAARVERSAIDLANKIANMQVVAWERRETPDNPHHGNLIFLDGIEKRKHKAFANAITLNAKPIPPLAGSGAK
jgi:hypothetical protein